MDASILELPPYEWPPILAMFGLCLVGVLFIAIPHSITNTFKKWAVIPGVLLIITAFAGDIFLSSAYSDKILKADVAFKQSVDHHYGATVEPSLVSITGQLKTRGHADITLNRGGAPKKAVLTVDNDGAVHLAEVPSEIIPLVK